MATTTMLTAPQWENHEKVIFRVVFIYFFLQVVPLEWGFYSELLSINWTHLYYGDIFNLVHYSPGFFESTQSFGNWAFIMVIAVIGAVLWELFEGSKEVDYNKLYYWIRVIVRYRLAIGIIAYGFIKLFPMQSPLPSISNLNTHYGDFNRWKLFSLTLGVVPSYEFFLGLVELTLGILLLFRKTASIAAFIILIFTGNVFVSNIAYEGGEFVYSFYLISLALFVLAHDLRRIISLLILQKPTAANKYKPVFTKQWQKYGRIIAKLSFVLFFVGLYGFKTRSGYLNGSYQYPQTKGLPGWAGLYNVSEFRINQQSLPYSSSDSARWQDVVFEKWNTISIRSNRAVVLDSSNTDHIDKTDSSRKYEFQGSAGRHYYTYEADTANQTILLHNRNKNYSDETLQLKYSKTGESRIILAGLDYNNDSVYVVLDRINKKYLLQVAAEQGRRRGLKL